ncbi:MAG TPA: hypothetical protein VEF89_09210, partial [Solirubrobacteraceae bacterium]|nr:hypothetical protein [Solirubrobacteraceae bacterium]
DPWDAIYTAARYLHAHRAPADWPAAIYAYNHADWYLTQVQQLAQHYAQTAGAGNTDLATDTASAGGCITAGPTTPGTDARILPDGLAAAPLDAPEQVQAAIPAPASGSPCTPPPGTPSSTWPGSCSTPPTGQQRQPPRPAADRAGNPPRSSPPNSPTATHGPNATHRDSDTPPHRESAQAIAARHGVHPRDRIHRHATGPLPHGQARRRRGAHQPVDHHSPTDTKPWNH